MLRMLILTTILALAPISRGGAEPQPDRPDSAAFRRIVTPVREADLVPSREVLAAAVKEPFFALIFTLIAADSLGTWTAADIEAFAAGWPHPTDLPLDELVGFSREAIPPAEAPTYEDAVCTRRLVIRLRDERFTFPMPYSIMGYHPGSLVVKSPLVLDEWHLGERSVTLRTPDAEHRWQLTALTVFQITKGFIVLDVDAWLDSLLGDVLDDAWTLGFAVAWQGPRLLGIGNSVGRTGKRIYGEFDFRTGEIENHGRPAAHGLSRYTRPWMTPIHGRGPLPWRGY